MLIIELDLDNNYVFFYFRTRNNNILKTCCVKLINNYVYIFV